jgi:hypothetical protein
MGWGLPPLLGRTRIVAGDLRDAKLAERSAAAAIAIATMGVILLSVELQERGQNTASVILWRFRTVVQIVRDRRIRTWKRLRLNIRRRFSACTRACKGMVILPRNLFNTKRRTANRHWS